MSSIQYCSIHGDTVFNNGCLACKEHPEDHMMKDPMTTVEDTIREIAKLRESSTGTMQIMQAAIESDDPEVKNAALTLGFEVSQILLNTLCGIAAENLASYLEKRRSHRFDEVSADITEPKEQDT